MRGARKNGAGAGAGRFAGAGLRHLRANAVAYLALFVALGGTSYGLATGSIGSRELADNSIRSRDIRNNEIRGKDIRNGSLLARDFKRGQLPAARPGPPGPPGPAGPPGAPGSDGSDAQFAGAAAGGALAGTYPAPQLAAGALSPANVGTFPAAKIRGNASNVIPDSCCLTQLPLPVEEFDNAGLHDPDSNTLTVPIDGMYVVSAAVTWANPADEPAVGTRTVALRRGAFSLAWDDVAAAESDSDIQGHSVSVLARLQAGDTVSLGVRQQGGGANERILFNGDAPWLAMAWIGPG